MRRKGVQRLREVLTPKSAEREYKEVSNVSCVTTQIARGPNSGSSKLSKSKKGKDTNRKEAITTCTSAEKETEVFYWAHA